MPKEHEHSAYRFHTDLFLSGLERIILVGLALFLPFHDADGSVFPQISRKASTTYYPTLHLELARYIAYAGRAGYELPYTVARLIGMPPVGHQKPPNNLDPINTSGPASGRNTPRQPMTPNRRGDAPALASPRRVESMRFD
jgi:hypothetical protein